MQSLAQFLGAHDPALPDAPPAPTPNPNISIRDFCRGVLRSQEYRDSIVQRIRLGTLPSAVEIVMYHYAEGKPVDRVEVKDTTVPAESLTPAQLDERAARLTEMARFLRRAEQFDEPLNAESVH